MEGCELFIGKPRDLLTIEREPSASDPGEVLHQRVLEILKHSPTMDKFGRPTRQSLTYGEAFLIAQEENPQAAIAYAESIHPSSGQ